MSAQPELPEPAHPRLDSMLSRRFGKETANYFAGSPLNRVSFLRTDHDFLFAAFRHPSTSFVLLRDLSPLAQDGKKLVFVPHRDVEPLVGADPFNKPEAQLIAEYNSAITTPQLVFLGIDESSKEGLAWKRYTGAPFFALDVTPKGSVEAQARGVVAEMERRGLAFLEGRTHLSFPAPEAAIFAQARALLDWNARNPFCAQCGQPTLSINAGTKRTCPPKDISLVPTPLGTTTPSSPLPPTVRPPCATRQGIHNQSFPRTDPTVIMAVLSSTSTHLLLGRGKRFPPQWYSTLAGFIEPAESIEDAVRREVWEESGVRLGRVVLHSTQPWPYPANLMVGAVAQAVPGAEDILLEHDPELEDARWVAVAEVAEALKGVEGELRLPPKTAIAHQLLKAVVEGSWLAGAGESKM
ncbi:MAG: NADH pyrophosphatase [Thelocarpon impressellum]|nr:MAG: NADH pyrophosphatase [Thelocarpon impressellum]